MALFVLFSQNPSRPITPEIRYCGSANSLVDIQPLLAVFDNEGLAEDTVLLVACFAGERAETLRSGIASLEAAEEGDDEDHEREQLEALLEGYLFPDPNECPAEPDLDDSMDGDHDSALASAGMGTDEDYGCFGNDE